MPFLWWDPTEGRYLITQACVGHKALLKCLLNCAMTITTSCLLWSKHLPVWHMELMLRKGKGSVLDVDGGGGKNKWSSQEVLPDMSQAVEADSVHRSNNRWDAINMFWSIIFKDRGGISGSQHMTSHPALQWSCGGGESFWCRSPLATSLSIWGFSDHCVDTAFPRTPLATAVPHRL